MEKDRKNWFSSDFHFGHTNVIKYDNRPFDSVKEMDNYILEGLEASFNKNDNFYYLGDFSLFKKHQIDNSEEYFKRIKETGVNMFFIKGNHDHSDMIKLYNKYGTYLGEQKKIIVNNQEIILNHYRMDVWDKSHHGSWHLHGHSHHSLPERDSARCTDVGINGQGFDYLPLEFVDIEHIMSRKTFKPIDHHGRKE